MASNNGKKVFLSGNEAIARGAYESGVHFAAAYPGTPSTEILENIAQYDEIRAEWSTNEKVALDVGYGAALGGARVIVALKHVGLNVALDTFMVTAFAGTNGGLVIISADDPGMHSSQNEQDNRYLAKFGKIPMLEPSDSQEAKDYVKIAFEISENYDIPVLLRTTTRTSHTKCLVELGERKEVRVKEYTKDERKHVVPVYGKLLRKNVEDRLKKLEEYSEKFVYNKIERGTNGTGIITSGISYQYAREVFPEASFLKLGMTFPLPKEKILEFISAYKKIYIIEELEPFIEEQLRIWGVKEITGKEKITNIGELSPEAVAKGLLNLNPPKDYTEEIDVIPRPPLMCAGCPHAGLFYVLHKLQLTVAGDIGCYTLGTLPPFSALDTTFCMGAGIGNAFGFSIAQKEELKNKVAAVIGDSTFLHGGIPGLIDIVYNKGFVTVIICDNKTTGMTGHQEHPGSGYTIKKEETFAVDYETLARAVGINYVKKVDPHNLAETEAIINEAVNLEEPAVVISDRICAMLPVVRYAEHDIYFIDHENCTACKVCYRIGCPAMERSGEKPEIDRNRCIGCTLCVQLCKFDAIKKVE